MRLSGIVTKDPTTREVTLKTPRPNEPKTKNVTEVTVLDDDGGDVITVQAWGDGPEATRLAQLRRGQPATDLAIIGVSSYMGTTRASLAPPQTSPAQTPKKA